MKMTMNCPKCNKPNREGCFRKMVWYHVVTKATEPLRELVMDGNRQEPVAGFGKYL